MKSRSFSLIAAVLGIATIAYLTGPDSKDQELLKIEAKSQSISLNRQKESPNKVVEAAKKEDRLGPIALSDLESQKNLELLSQCTDKNLSSFENLSQAAQHMGWADLPINKVVKRNLIYKSNHLEKRLHILPSQNSSQWRVQLFDVDDEGLPIPRERVTVSSLNEAIYKFDQQLINMTLDSEETLLEIDQGSLTGQVLLVEGQVEEIQLYNKNSAKIFECVSSSCVCKPIKI